MPTDLLERQVATLTRRLDDFERQAKQPARPNADIQRLAHTVNQQQQDLAQARRERDAAQRETMRLLDEQSRAAEALRRELESERLLRIGVVRDFDGMRQQWRESQTAIRALNDRFPMNAVQSALDGHFHVIRVGQTGAGAPTHIAPIYTLYYDTTGDDLYINDNGYSTWIQLTTGVGGGHNMLSATHSDSAVQGATRASLIYGNATPAWDELVAPATGGDVLYFNGADVAWAEGALGRVGLDTLGRFAVIRDGSYASYQATSYSSAVAADGAFLSLQRARGTLAAPTAVASGDVLGQIDVNGYQGGFGNGIFIKAIANQAWVAGAHGTRLEIFTTPDGGTTPTLAATLDADGDLTLAQNIVMAAGKTVDGVDISVHAAAADGHPDHTDAVHTGKIGEVPWGPLMLTLKKALPAATNNATLDDDWVYKSPWTNEVVRINNWYIRFESNLAANATFELRKNGTAISGASITVNSGSRDAAIDAFTETTLADADSLEVWQTAGNAEDIGGSAYVYGDQDVLAVVNY